MNESKKKRSLYIILAVVTIILIGIGYAYLTNNLNIVGRMSVEKNTWEINFENIKVSEGSVVADAPTIVDNSTINYQIALTKPGDFYEYSVDIVNKGTIDAVIDDVTIIGLTDEQNKYISYDIKYSDGKNIATGDLLSSNGGKKNIKIRVEYKTDITANNLPTTNQTLDLTFNVNYRQKDK